jgi:hypothetical protein
MEIGERAFSDFADAARRAGSVDDPGFRHGGLHWLAAIFLAQARACANAICARVAGFRSVSAAVYAKLSVIAE